MDRSTVRLVALLTGTAVGGGTYYWLVADPLLVGGVGLFWAVGVGLSVRHREWVGGSADDWEASRWSGAQAGLSSLAVMAVVASPTLSLSAEHRFALGLLVLGVALTTMHLGVGMALEACDGSGDAPGTGGADDDPDRDAADPARPTRATVDSGSDATARASGEESGQRVT